MLKQLFGFGRARNREITDALYEAIVAAARQPFFYSQWRVPDTPLGRFEMLSVHMFLFMHRARGETGLKDITQELVDEFFLDVDHSIRELGIADAGVPRRMKRLARMFYGRAKSYGEALEAGDREGMAKALARNVLPLQAEWPQSSALASYMFRAWADLSNQPAAELARGRIQFPLPEVVHA